MIKYTLKKNPDPSVEFPYRGYQDNSKTVSYSYASILSKNYQFRNFPCYSTMGQLSLGQGAINLLAHLTTWTMLQHRPEVLAAFDKVKRRHEKAISGEGEPNYPGGPYPIKPQTPDEHHSHFDIDDYTKEKEESCCTCR